MAAGEIRTVTVIGTGTIGASWSCLFLAHGLDVVATDIRPGAEADLRAAIDRFWPSLPDTVRATGQRGTLRFEPDLEAACATADFVQENAIERLEEKVELFRRIDAATPPHAVLASSSSAIAVSDMQRACRTPGRVVLGHPFNPPHLVPLVEVAGGTATDDAAIAVAEAFYTGLGKACVRLRREIYGHIANRLQAAIFREAIHLLDSGIASAEDIDRAVSEGPGLRWALMGPLQTYRLAGGDRGMAGFWEMFTQMQQTLWDDLGQPRADADLAGRVTAAVEAAYADRSVQASAAERDVKLPRILAARSEPG